MGKKKAALAARALGFLRIALLWARKGGAFRCGRLSEASRDNFPNGHRGGSSDGYPIRDGEMELSFSETPVFGQGSTRSAGRRPGSVRPIFSILPCGNPPSPPDVGFNDDDEYGWRRRQASFRRCNGAIGDGDGEEDFASVEWMEGSEEADEEEEEEFASAEWLEGPQEAIEEENGADAKAEEFIARFYQQMKLQRQVSFLRYHEMLQRGT